MGGIDTDVLSHLSLQCGTSVVPKLTQGYLLGESKVRQKRQSLKRGRGGHRGMGGIDIFIYFFVIYSGIFHQYIVLVSQETLIYLHYIILDLFTLLYTSIQNISCI